MTKFSKGSLCISTAGHDKGTIYVIVGCGEKVFLADGKYKKLASPKKKNLAHIKLIDYTDAELINLMAENKLHDENIKYSIKNYLIHIGGK